MKVEKGWRCVESIIELMLFVYKLSSTTRHGSYNIVCGVAIARRPGLVLVGSHVANVALDQSESYPPHQKSREGKLSRGAGVGRPGSAWTVTERRVGGGS